MVAGFRVVRLSFTRLWDEMLGMVGANIIWFVVSLPLFALFYFLLPEPWAILLAFLTLLVPNPLAGGVHLVASQVVRGDGAEVNLAWSGLGRNFGKTLIVSLIDCVALAIVLSNVVFYLGSSNGLLRVIGLVWAVLLVIWLGVQVYLYPFILTRPDRGVLNLFRDSFFLALANPIFTITVLAFVFLAIFLSVMFGLAVPFLLMALIALLENTAMAELAEKYTGRKVERHGAVK